MDWLADTMKGMSIYKFQPKEAPDGRWRETQRSKFCSMLQMGEGGRAANQKKQDSLLMNLGARQYVFVLSLVFRVRGRLHSEAKPQISF